MKCFVSRSCYRTQRSSLPEICGVWFTRLEFFSRLATYDRQKTLPFCLHENSMYVFGGSTATCMAFNDLWRLDLDSRQWVKPITMGSYPSSKTCATMLYHNNSFILFGEWSHPSPYPHPQVC